VPLYVFQYPDFIKDYFDAQNHPPGKAVIKEDIDNRIGKLKYYGAFNPSPTFPLEIPFQHINKLQFEIRTNLDIIDGEFVEYPDVEDIEATTADYINNGYTLTKDGLDLIF